MGMRVAAPIAANRDELRQLAQWARGAVSNPRVVLRAKIVLDAIGGQTNKAIAHQLGVSPRTVRLWRTRFATGSLHALYIEAPKAGRPRRFTEEAEARIALEVLEARAIGVPFRQMARALGLPPTTVWRVYRRGSHHGGRPARPIVKYLASVLGLSERHVARKYGRGGFSPPQSAVELRKLPRSIVQVRSHQEARLKPGLARFPRPRKPGRGSRA